MTDLAERIVALGVGRQSIHNSTLYWLGDSENLFTKKEFTHSWEVAGALMEKCNYVDMEKCNYVVRGVEYQVKAVEGSGLEAKNHGIAQSDSAPHAIILATVEALEAA